MCLTPALATPRPISKTDAPAGYTSDDTHADPARAGHGRAEAQSIHARAGHSVYVTHMADARAGQAPHEAQMAPARAGYARREIHSTTARAGQSSNDAQNWNARAGQTTYDVHLVYARAGVSRTCPARPGVSVETPVFAAVFGMGGTGLEPAPPGYDRPRQSAPQCDGNPPVAAGFRLLRPPNRDSARPRATPHRGVDLSKTCPSRGVA